MKSHEYGKRLKEIGDFLLSREEFETDIGPRLFFHYYDKDRFMNTVKALGSGKKTVSDGQWPECVFTPSSVLEIQVSIPRDKVCRKVQDIKWECEPFLSADEEALLENNS